MLGSRADECPIRPVRIPATLIYPAQRLPCLARFPTHPDGSAFGP
jgi:hypothetical protein